MLFGGGERKSFAVFIENLSCFPTFAFCKKGKKILVCQMSISFDQIFFLGGGGGRGERL